jgi:predicted DNA-binding protein
MSDPGLNKELRIRVTEEKRKRIEKIAHERSEPGDRVSLSDVLREAIDEYLDRVESDPKRPEEQPAD